MSGANAARRKGYTLPKNRSSRPLSKPVRLRIPANLNRDPLAGPSMVRPGATGAAILEPLPGLGRLAVRLALADFALPSAMVLDYWVYQAAVAGQPATYPTHPGYNAFPCTVFSPTTHYRAGVLPPCTGVGSVQFLSAMVPGVPPDNPTSFAYALFEDIGGSPGSGQIRVRYQWNGVAGSNKGPWTPGTVAVDAVPARGAVLPAPLPSFIPALDPMALPANAPEPVPRPVRRALPRPGRLLPNRSPTEQPQHGPLPRPRLDPPLPPTVTIETGKPPRTAPARFTPRRPPPTRGRRKTREHKARYTLKGASVVNKLVQAANATLGVVTETADLVDALIKGLPKKIRLEAQKGGLHQRTKSLLSNLDQMDWGKALTAVAKNQLEDAVIGRTHAKLRKAGDKAAMPTSWPLSLPGLGNLPKPDL